MPSVESLQAAAALPGRRTASSDGLGWGSVLARVYEEPAIAEAFTTVPVPELLVVVQLSGRSCLESRHGGRWLQAEYGPGSVGVTAPGNSSTLRWRHSWGTSRTLHLHLDVELVRGVAHVLGKPHAADQLPDALVLDDPLVLAAARALGTAVEQGAGPLYSESVTQALAAALVERCAPLRRRPPGRSPVLDVRRVAQIVEYMDAHMADPVNLDQLAAVVHLSKYHFLRAFSHATGSTPYRYLNGLRMRRAAQRLRTSDASVTTVAAECGFTNPSRFAAVFRHHHGCSPAAYRRAMRVAGRPS